MGLNKVEYVDRVTVISAENMNDIQEAIISTEDALSGGQNGHVFTMTPTGPKWAAPSGVTEEMKQALLQIAEKVAYIDDQGQTYYDDLYNAFYPPKTLASISAAFDQDGAVIYDNVSLDDLRQYLVVMAIYDDNTREYVTGYTLSGTLEPGTSTVTVTYNGLTATFDVEVTAAPVLESITAAYTQSGTVYDTDTLDSLKAELVVTANYSDGSTETLSDEDYVLSGTLEAGTSTITVSYGGKTTTFSVVVTAWDYAWDYSMGYLSANGWTMGSDTGSSVLQDDGLLITSNRVFKKNSNPTCTTCVFETTFTLVSFDSSTQSIRGYRLIIFNGNRAVTINVKETGLEAYNYTTTSYDTAAPVELNREYVLRVEVGQTTGKLYLDGDLVLTVPLGTTTSTQSIVSQIGSNNGRQTLVKNIRYSFQS